MNIKKLAPEASTEQNAVLRERERCFPIKREARKSPQEIELTQREIAGDFGIFS